MPATSPPQPQRGREANARKPRNAGIRQTWRISCGLGIDKYACGLCDNAFVRYSVLQEVPHGLCAILSQQSLPYSSIDIVMDPLTAIGLVANIAAFVDFGYKVIAAAREIQQSVTGATSGNENIEFLSMKMQALTIDLKSSKPLTAMTADELRLNELVLECHDLSKELTDLLGALKAKSPNSKRHAFGAVLRNIRKKDEKDKLVARLDRCRQQLHLQLSQTSR